MSGPKKNDIYREELANVRAKSETVKTAINELDAAVDQFEYIISRTEGGDIVLDE